MSEALAKPTEMVERVRWALICAALLGYGVLVCAHDPRLFRAGYDAGVATRHAISALSSTGGE